MAAKEAAVAVCLDILAELTDRLLEAQKNLRNASQYSGSEEPRNAVKDIHKSVKSWGETTAKALYYNPNEYHNSRITCEYGIRRERVSLIYPGFSFAPTQDRSPRAHLHVMGMLRFMSLT